MDDFLRDCHGLGFRVAQVGFEDYLSDESHFTGFASGVVRVSRVSEVVGVTRSAFRWNVPLTVVSGKTSITGGPVPLGGIIIDVKGLDSIDRDDPTKVGPGVMVKPYKDYVESRGFFYPPDPTSQESCTIGGNVACNASGALSYLYGPTRDHIRGLTVVLSTGAVLAVERGDVISSGGGFRIPPELMSPAGAEEFVIPLPRTRTPEWSFCKNAAGLFSRDPMDLVDLFIGSEGILGTIVEIRTTLSPRRKPFFGLMLYLPTLETTVRVVRLLDDMKRFFHDGDRGAAARIEASLPGFAETTPDSWKNRFRAVLPSCMEWLGASVARFMPDDRRGQLADAYGCLYVEQEYSLGVDPLEIARQWAELVDAFNRSLQGHSPEIRTEVALDEKQIRSMRKDRESVPEKLNEAIRPGMVKVGTDFSAPIHHLDRVMKLYEESLRGTEHYLFGHIGNGHVHVNMLPHDRQELEKSRALCVDLAREICSMGGSVSAEHGIGKLKHELLEIMVGAQGIEDIRKVKRILDPRNILNRHDMVADESLSTDMHGAP